MLREESQTRRTNICFHIEEVPKEANSETEGTRGHQGLGEVGVRFLSGMIEELWKQMVVIVYTTFGI